MNGKCFDLFKKKDTKTKKCNIYVCFSEKDETESPETKKIKLLENLDFEKKLDNNVSQILEKINSNLASLSKKKLKSYDTIKEKDEIFYLNSNDLEETKDMKFFRAQMIPTNMKRLVETKDNIKYLILEILFTSKIKETKEIQEVEEVEEVEEKIFFFKNYQYNQVAKKTFFKELTDLDEEYKLKKPKGIYINFSPDLILYEDELYILNNFSSKIFNLKEYFEKVIKDNKNTLNEMFISDSKTFTTQNQKIYLVRGIKNKQITLFKDKSLKDKKNSIEEYKLGFKKKYSTASKLIIDEDGKINLLNLSSNEKEEIIKFVTNKSAFKCLNRDMTTSVN